MAMLVTGVGGSLSIHATKQHNSGWYPDDHFLPPVFTVNELWHSCTSAGHCSCNNDWK